MKNQVLTTLFILLMALTNDQASAKAKEAAAPAANGAGGEAEAPKLYLQLEPPLVVNVDEGDVVRFLQINTQIQYSKQLALPIIEKHMPAIRHAMIMLLSGQSVTAIKTSEGKEKLRESTLKAIQQVMTETTGEPIVDAVYFTGFVIQ